MSKKLTEQQIRDVATKNGIEYACLRAAIQVEATGGGFIDEDTPKILFEPHVFYRLLTAKNYITIRNKAMAENPRICYPKWGQYPYGKTSEQHDRLKIACEYDRDSALQACSWGLGQVMGSNYQSLGYDSLQEFVNAMYADEAGQLDAMCRFIKVNGLLDKLNRHDWAGFAKGYNGSGYAKNAYDKKLAQAYHQFA